MTTGMIVSADGARIAVTRIVPPEPRQREPAPVILVHGSYANRKFWVSDKGIGMGPYLASLGFDVFIPELRGHGFSPKDNFSKIRAQDHMEFDLPAIESHVEEMTGKKAFWIGHSFGGLYVLGALSAGWLSIEKTAGVVTFGSQITYGDTYLKIPPLAWVLKIVLRLAGRLPAPLLGLGPEPEPAAEILEIIGWKSLSGKWVSGQGFEYEKGLGSIDVPALVFAAARDKNDPPRGCRIIYDLLGARDKQFVVLGKSSGFCKDYDHVGMVVSKEAQREVWPMVADWITKRLEDQAGKGAGFPEKKEDTG